MYGTIIVSIIAIVISLPLSIFSTIFLVELVPPSLRNFLISISDLMASFPTIIYGFWGLIKLGPFLTQYVFYPMYKYLGFIPFFSTAPLGPSYLLASIVLSIMISPFASSIIRETYTQVPKYIDESVLSLGMGKWGKVMIKLRYIRSGILVAFTLAYGRAIGETVAVGLTVGGVLNASISLFSPGYTIPSFIANVFEEAFTKTNVSSFFMLSLILLAIGLIFIVIAKLLIIRSASLSRWIK
ncbi:phosphate ABC transporter permease [Sulfolobus acidocaldarius SUSAZ]|nr:phosphate ABC transporter permease [Sulfolobus acidocaldarius SUSAZ]